MRGAGGRRDTDAATEVSAGVEAVEIRSVVKVYGEGAHGVTALQRVSLTIRDNEFFTLLGPSGCGKTTLLRLIAGFEKVTAGEIRLYGEALDRLPPNLRPVNTVFQHYALFPHMTVARNVAFGLERLKRPPAEVARTVREMLALVQLDGYGERRPQQLSGGQQQRVALARALAPHPRVLLLDEPLSALDLKLRQAMRVELKRLQRETGITFIFVTHDQDEALSMSDRVAVISAGRVEQVGTPEEVYDHPRTRFVADFVGDTNLIEATVSARTDAGLRCRVGAGPELDVRGDEAASVGDPVTLGFRPENVRLGPPRGDGGVGGRLVERTYLGDVSTFTVDLGGGCLISARCSNGGDQVPDFRPGSEVCVEFATDSIRILRS